MKKIAVIYPEIEQFSNQGGAFAIKGFEILRRLKLRDIQVFAPYSKGPQYQIRNIKVTNIYASKYLQHSFPQKVYRAIYNFEIAIRTYKKFDTVLVFNRPWYCPLIRFFNPKAQIILFLGNNHLLTMPEKKSTKSIRNTDLIICVSEFVRKGIINKFPCAKENW